MKLTKKDREYLVSSGYFTSDLPEIEAAISHIKYYEISVFDEKHISRKSVLGRLTREQFLSGVSRATYHGTAVQEIPHGYAFIMFENCK